MKHIFASTFLAAFLCVGAVYAEDKVVEILHPSSSSSMHGEHVASSGPRSVTVDQIVNSSALIPSELFLFKPDYVELVPGDTITFLNTTGTHTVRSIDAMIPDGAEPFDVTHSMENKVTFDKPGVYGIRCKVHGRVGMVMLVKVGNDLPNLEKAKAVRHRTAIQDKFDKLFAKIR